MANNALVNIPVLSVNGLTGNVNITYTDLGAIEEAPNDGSIYARQNEGWVISSSGVPAPASDNYTYSYRNNDWVRTVYSNYASNIIINKSTSETRQGLQNKLDALPKDLNGGTLTIVLDAGTHSGDGTSLKVSGFTNCTIEIKGSGIYTSGQQAPTVWTGSLLEVNNIPHSITIEKIHFLDSLDLKNINNIYIKNCSFGTGYVNIASGSKTNCYIFDSFFNNNILGYFNARTNNVILDSVTGSVTSYFIPTSPGRVLSIQYTGFDYVAFFSGLDPVGDSTANDNFYFGKYGEKIESIEEAPNDGNIYARQNEGWSILPSSGISAPAADGYTYSYKNNDWVRTVYNSHGSNIVVTKSIVETRQDLQDKLDALPKDLNGGILYVSLAGGTHTTDGVDLEIEGFRNGSVIVAGGGTYVPGQPASAVWVGSFINMSNLKTYTVVERIHFLNSLNIYNCPDVYIKSCSFGTGYVYTNNSARENIYLYDCYFDNNILGYFNGKESHVILDSLTGNITAYNFRTNYGSTLKMEYTGFDYTTFFSGLDPVGDSASNDNFYFGKYGETSPGIEEAPINGSAYVRKDGGWEVSDASYLENDAVYYMVAGTTHTDINSFLDTLPKNLGGKHVRFYFSEGFMDMEWTDNVNFNEFYNGNISFLNSASIDNSLNIYESIKFNNCSSLNINFYRFSITKTGGASNTTFIELTDSLSINVEFDRIAFIYSVAGTSSLVYSPNASIINFSECSITGVTGFVTTSTRKAASIELHIYNCTGDSTYIIYKSFAEQTIYSPFNIYTDGISSIYTTGVAVSGVPYTLSTYTIAP